MMDKFGHEPLHYPDEVQPDKHKREQDPKDARPKARRRPILADEERRRTQAH